MAGNARGVINFEARRQSQPAEIKLRIRSIIEAGNTRGVINFRRAKEAEAGEEEAGIGRDSVIKTRTHSSGDGGKNAGNILDN